MMKTDTILEFFGLKEIESKKEPDVDDIFKAEIEEVLAEMAVVHADTDQYTKLVDNLHTLTEGYNEFKRAQAEIIKASAELERNKKDRWLKICDTSVKVTGIVLSAGLTAFYFGVEQGRPTPVRYINKCQDFLTKM
jgi:hypothetical protein